MKINYKIISNSSLNPVLSNFHKTLCFSQVDHYCSCLVSLYTSPVSLWGRDSVVGTETRNGLEGPGLKRRWG